MNEDRNIVIIRYRLSAALFPYLELTWLTVLRQGSLVGVVQWPQPQGLRQGFHPEDRYIPGVKLLHTVDTARQAVPTVIFQSNFVMLHMFYAGC